MSGIKRLGDFTVGSDNSRGFFVKDNLDAQVEIGKFSPFIFSEVVDNKLYLGSNQLTFSKGISDLLVSGGAISTSGYYGGQVGIIASLVQVPEPSLILGMIGVSLSALTSYRSKKNNVVAGARNKQ